MSTRKANVFQNSGCQLLFSFSEFSATLARRRDFSQYDRTDDRIAENNNKQLSPLRKAKAILWLRLPQIGTFLLQEVRYMGHDRRTGMRVGGCFNDLADPCYTNNHQIFVSQVAY